MTISPHAGLPLSSGFAPANRPRTAPLEPKQSVEQIETIRASSHTPQRIRQTILAQPMRDQNLSHRGAHAKDIYQDIERADGIEMMPRLNVVA